MALTLPGIRSFDLSNKFAALTVQQLRFRNRPNLKNPLPMHYKRKRLIETCKPILPKTTPVCDMAVVTPKKAASIVDENPYALYLAGKLRRDFTKYPMVAIFHTDTYTGLELLNFHTLLHDNNFKMDIQRSVNRAVTTAAFEGTKWAPIIPLTYSKTVFGFCETTDVAKLNCLLRKMPAFVLMALVYENRLLHRDDIDRVAKLSTLLTQQAQLSSTLNMPTSNLCQTIMMSQMSLTNSLSSYIASQQESSSSSSSSESGSDSSSSDSDNEMDKTKQS